MRGDGLAQRSDAAAGRGLQQLSAQVADGAAQQPRPHRKGEALLLRAVAGEVQQGRPGFTGRPIRFRQRISIHRTAVFRRGRLKGELRHIVAALRLRGHKTLVNQPVVRRLHRDAADAQVFGEAALGGQAAARREPPGQDVLPEGIRQLLVQRPLVFACQGIGKQAGTLLSAGMPPGGKPGVFPCQQHHSIGAEKAQGRFPVSLSIQKNRRVKPRFCALGKFNKTPCPFLTELIKIRDSVEFGAENRYNNLL